MENQVIATILGRVSVRRFEERPLTDEQVNSLLEVMRRAPSAGNLQPWRFAVVRSRPAREALARAAGRQAFVGQAPVVFVISVVPAESARYYGERGRTLYCIQDTAAAVQNLLIAAEALGLGAVWVGAFDEDQVARIIGLNPGVRPVALVPVGHPRNRSRLSRRRPLDEVVIWIE